MSLPAPSTRRNPARIGVLGIVLALAATALPATPATADQRLLSTFQDDARILDGSLTKRNATLQEIQALGAQRIRLTVAWRTLAPAPAETTKPTGFDGADPNAYPAEGWVRLDAAIAAIQARGMSVHLNPTSPAPSWATSEATDGRLEAVTDPDPAEFGAFVAALGRRYDGRFVPPGRSTPLPKVTVWSIWNEPNRATSLSPQWTGTGATAHAASPQRYRALLDAAWTGLTATGHHPSRGDIVLIGETAPKGIHPAVKVTSATDGVPPLPFLRSLYCVSELSIPLRGPAATAVGCPETPAPAAFAAAHPALFAMTGVAHHPYELRVAPGELPEFPNAFVTMANLPTLTQQLDRLMSRYAVKRTPVPVYLTEYGYQTNPPDDVAPSLGRQAAWINEAEYIAWSNPRVRTTAQHLLVDEGPMAGDVGEDAKWATFQTGLRFGFGSESPGKAKPGLDAYRTVLNLPATTATRSGTLRVWGRVRPDAAAPGASRRVEIQVRPRGSRAFRRVATAKPTRFGFFTRSIRVDRSGSVRLRWTQRSTRYLSRSAGFTVPKRG